MTDDRRSDIKRKYDDHSSVVTRRSSGFSAPVASASPDFAATPPLAYNSASYPFIDIEAARQKALSIANKIQEDAAKRPRLENGGPQDGSADRGFSYSTPEHITRQAFPHVGFVAPSQIPSSKKIEVPNGRVGVIIGKSGETIKSLVHQSGARIQVTRDADSDPTSATRIVELQGTAEQINRAEQMIHDVLKEAESGGSITASSWRRPGQGGGEQYVTKVPNNKVGLLIGKGGETIKNMQLSSGASIQIIPLHLPPGDMSMERTVQIDGTSEQVEAAKKLVNDIVTSENRVYNPQSGTGYRPPRPSTGWAPGPPPMQQPAYGYMQPGPYSGQPQYNTSQPPYGGYPPSGGYQTGWDQTNTSNQQAASVGGYDYYNQQQPQQQPSGSNVPADNTNYSYGQPSTYPSQGSYGDDATYSQSASGQQGYAVSDGYSAGYNSLGGYSQAVASNPQASYNQQGYTATPAYGGASGSTQDACTPYGTQNGQAPVPSAQQNPSLQPSSQPQGYGQQQTPSGNMQPGYGAPSASQSGYVSQPPAPVSYGQESVSHTQPNYVSQPPAPASYGQESVSHTQPNYVSQQPAPASYGQPQSQKMPPSPGSYGQTQQPLEYSQVAPAQSGFSQSAQLQQSQSGYSHGQQHSYGGAQPPNQAAYGQQPSHQPYGDSYASGGYSQSHGTYDPSASTPSVPGGTKASPQG